MGYFIKVLKYGKSYKIYGFLNILFNVFYAIFSALAFVSFIPMLDVLFKQTKEVFQKPVYTGITDLKDYLQDYLNYYISRQLEIDVSTTLEDVGCRKEVGEKLIKEVIAPSGT